MNKQRTNQKPLCTILQLVAVSYEKKFIAPGMNRLEKNTWHIFLRSCQLLPFLHEKEDEYLGIHHPKIALMEEFQ